MRLLFEDANGQWLLDPCGNSAPTEGGVVVWDERVDRELPQDFDEKLVGGYVNKDGKLAYDKGLHEKNEELCAKHAAQQDAAEAARQKAVMMAHPLVAELVKAGVIAIEDGTIVKPKQ